MALKLGYGLKGVLSFLECISRDFDKYDYVLRTLRLDGSQAYDPISDVREYVWSPDGKAIAYSTGTRTESNHYISEGTYILHLDKQKVKKLPVAGFCLHWAGFDKNLYFTAESSEGNLGGDRVYNPRKDRLESVNYSYFKLSPGGSYYFETCLDDFAESPINILSRRTHENIVSTKKCPISPIMASGIGHHEWLSDNLLRLCTTLQMNDCPINYYRLLLNVKRGEIRLSKNKILTIGKDDTELICCTDDCEFIIEKYADLALLTDDFFLKYLKPPKTTE